jgi:hypothetical protein
MKNSSFWKMVMLAYWSENTDTSHEHKLCIRHHYWERFGNVEIMYIFILPTDAWQKNKKSGLNTANALKICQISNIWKWSKK